MAMSVQIHESIRTFLLQITTTTNPRQRKQSPLHPQTLFGAKSNSKSLVLCLTIRTVTLIYYTCPLDHQKTEKLYMYTFTDRILIVSYLRKVGIDNLYYLLKTNKNKGTQPVAKSKRRVRLNGIK